MNGSANVRMFHDTGGCDASQLLTRSKALMKAAELLVRCLENEGVQLVFGQPGEETLELMDAFLDSRIRFIETRHEQGAAFMADVCTTEREGRGLSIDAGTRRDQFADRRG